MKNTSFIEALNRGAVWKEIERNTRKGERKRKSFAGSGWGYQTIQLLIKIRFQEKM